MSELQLDKNHQVFNLLDVHVKKALKSELEVSGQWEINKEYFDEVWTAQQWDESVIQKFNVRMSDSEIETDFHEEDDPESLSNCFVELECTGALKDIFIASGLKNKFSIDVFNEIHSSNISLLDQDDVENNVSLFKVYIENEDLLKLNQNKLIEFLKKS